MRQRKYPHADIRSYYRRALELGFIGSLSLMILAFQLSRYEIRTEFKLEPADVEFEVEQIPPTEQIKRPPPPARPAVPIPTETDEVPADETLEPLELDFSELPPPPPPPQDRLSEESFTFIPYDKAPEMIGGLPKLMRLLEYPELALKAGMEGIVTIGVLIDEEGRTAKTEVLRSSSPGLGFEEAARKALMQMRWKPAYQRDRPVKVWYAVPVRFQLK